MLLPMLEGGQGKGHNSGHTWCFQICHFVKTVNTPQGCCKGRKHLNCKLLFSFFKERIIRGHYKRNTTTRGKKNAKLELIL